MTLRRDDVDWVEDPSRRGWVLADGVIGLVIFVAAVLPVAHALVATVEHVRRRDRIDGARRRLQRVVDELRVESGVDGTLTVQPRPPTDVHAEVVEREECRWIVVTVRVDGHDLVRSRPVGRD